MKILYYVPHIDDDSVGRVIRIGEYDLTTEKDCYDEDNCLPPAKEYAIEEMIPHEGYVSSPLYINDIGLLRLAEEIPFDGAELCKR